LTRRNRKLFPTRGIPISEFLDFTGFFAAGIIVALQSLEIL
jgi:hypothetical protein